MDVGVIWRSRAAHCRHMQIGRGVAAVGHIHTIIIGVINGDAGDHAARRTGYNCPGWRGGGAVGGAGHVAKVISHPDDVRIAGGDCNGADIVVGEGQSIGVGLQFGGPYVGLFACKEKYVRQMPGRLCGETVDAEGKRGFVLTLSTREQHIRREKATSNICTNSGLCALAFSIHMTLLGEKGLRDLAMLNHKMAVQVADRLVGIPGVELVNESFFNEFTLRLSKEARPVVRAMADRKVLGGVSLGRLYPGVESLENGLVIAVTEVVTAEDIEALATALTEVLA